VTEIYIESDGPRGLNESDAALMEVAVRAALGCEDFIAGCEIYVTATDNNGIRELNNTHRGIDAETDVLSFPLYTRGELLTECRPEKMILGDIFISVEKAESQAAEYGHARERELAFLTVHGALHLLGYDHELAEDEAIMTDKQERILRLLSLERN